LLKRVKSRNKEGVIMHRIAAFEKVSFPQFMEGMLKDFPEIDRDNLQELYDELSLPKRATRGSAGYDFYAPTDFILNPGETIRIPTGIRVKMEEDWVLQLYPRSGLGFKFRLQLNNTVGIIDSDYYHSDNEGHIMARITNDSNEGKTLEVKRGTGFMQGIFLQYGITMDDETVEVRNGGFGSTS
jgi:dUTP pyrophosphatase